MRLKSTITKWFSLATHPAGYIINSGSLPLILTGTESNVHNPRGAAAPKRKERAFRMRDFSTSSGMAMCRADNAAVSAV
jgi:hypothetical protein